MDVKQFDPAPFRRAAGLSVKQAAYLANISPEGWKNWEANLSVPVKRSGKVRDVLRAAMMRRIELCQAQIEQIDAHQ